jgi:phosphate starvation-inducible PhoH-like protein
MKIKSKSRKPQPHFSQEDNNSPSMRSGEKSNIRQFSNGFQQRKEIYKPKNLNQKLYYEYLNDSNVKIVVGVGPAGCGKTLFACENAIRELNNKNIEKIIITRPLISVDEESVGFLPGSLTEKMYPWTRPIIDIFEEYYSLNDIKNMISSGKIEFAPLAYMRGRTFKNCIIIADEMQNSSPNQMLMLTTRIGLSSKLIITGDLKQTDRTGSNGLSDFIDKVRLWNKNLSKRNAHKSMVHGDGGVKCNPSAIRSEEDHFPELTKENDEDENKIMIVEFDRDDIERSPLVSKIMEIYSPSQETEKRPSPSIRPNKSEDKSFLNGNEDASIFPKHYFTKNMNLPL